MQFCIICHCGHRSHFLFPTTSYIRLKQEITEITRHGGVFYRREMSVNKKCHREVIFLLINIESRHILLTIMHVNSLKKNVLGQKKTSTRDGGHWVMSHFVGNVVVYKTLFHLIRRQIIKFSPQSEFMILNQVQLNCLFWKYLRLVACRPNLIHCWFEF